MSLQEVIETAHSQSPSSILARHNFIVNYWQFRTYKAQFLPSLNLQGSLGNYNRSLVSLQDAQSGEIGYIENNTLSNSLGLSIDQNIPFTGGSVSVITSLNRLDQFSPTDKITYNSQPVRITLSQPINAYNSLKWEKKIEPKKFELAKRNYLNTMEGITVTAVTYFFDLLLAQRRVEIARESHRNTSQLYNIAWQRFEIGSITRDELQQLELKLLNDSLAIGDHQLSEKTAMQRLRNFLGYNESVEIQLQQPPQNPDITLDFHEVMNMVNLNSPDNLENEISSLSAHEEIARAKANSGLKASLYAQFGLNQVGDDLGIAYKSPLDQEILGVSLSLPIMDWGLGRGKVKVAKSQAQVIESQIEQAENQLRENITLQVLRFNQQGGQCNVSQKADQVGQSRYATTKERFLNGTIGVTELNNAQTEMDNAQLRYLQDLSNYWIYYYNIQKATLFNFIKNEKVDANFEELTNE
ncbi:MAG: TolC family protein [Bacteroidales bacterium]|nr:TolC family protein [Bacteroidales bacterium]